MIVAAENSMDHAVGPLRHPGAAAVVPLRRHGEPAADLRNADRDCRRQVARARSSLTSWHSWSGNLVTNATWRDFWLNEGFTTYLERRIVEVLYGRHMADMQAAIGVGDLAESRKTLEVAGDRTLLPDLKGRDPDDAFSNVPYEQGQLFLVFLESNSAATRSTRSCANGSTSTHSRARRPRSSCPF